MNYFNYCRIKKQLSPETLEETLNNDKNTYWKIAHYCICASIGLSNSQRLNAENVLKTFLPENPKAYVGSRISDDMREIFWTCEGVSCWQKVIEIPACLMSYNLLAGKMYYISTN